MPLKFDGLFEGGGVKGIGLVGALAYLEDQGAMYRRGSAPPARRELALTTGVKVSP